MTRMLSTTALAVALLIQVGAAHAAIFNSAQTACDISEPRPAASDFMVSFVPTDPGNAGKCPQLCKRWANACKAMAGTVAGCFKSAAARITGLRKADCNTLNDSAACVDTVKPEFAAAKNAIQASKDLGREECARNGLAFCLNVC